MQIHKLFTRKNAKSIIAFYILLLIPTIYGISLFRIDYDFEKFFPKEDPLLDQYISYREQFGSDNDFLLVALESKSNIVSDSSFYNTLKKIESALKNTDNVTEVIGPSTLEVPIITAVGQFKKPLLKQGDALNDIVADPVLYPSFISKNGKNALILVQHVQSISKKKADKLIADVRALTKPITSNYTVRLAGKSHGQHHYISEMSFELSFFTSISVLLLIIILLLFFRAVWAVTIPLTVIMYSVALLTAGIHIAGQSLSILTIILPTIIFVVGISDMVHLLNHYLDELRLGKSKVMAIQDAVKVIGKATFLTSVTTAIGFLTLLVSSIEPVRQFGMYSAIGVGIAYVLSFSLFPALLLLLKTPAISRNEKNKERWGKFLTGAYAAVFKHKKLVYTTCLLLAVGGIYGFTQLKINNYLLEDWADDDPQRLNYVYLEENFGGVRPFDIILQSEKGIMNPDVLAEIKKLEIYLTDTYKVNNIVSPVSIFRMINRAENFGKADDYQLVDNDKKLEKQIKRVDKLNGTKRLKELVSEDGKKGRLFGRLTDYGGYIFKQKNKALNAYVDKNIDPKLLTISQTGMPYIIDKNNEDLSSQMIYGLLIALASVSIIMMLLFKNVKMLFISLIPNLLPLLGLALYMYLAGVDIKVATAIIYTIAFGIAVDDTIHYLSRLKIELNAGVAMKDAIFKSYRSSGKAIIITSLILCSGFLSLAFSSFASTFYLGLLISIVLGLAIVIDLSLLPLLCDRFLKDKKAD